MSKENVALARRWFEEVWNKARPEAIDEMFPADGVAHGIGMIPIRGPAEFRAFQAETLAAFAGLAFTVDDAVAEGDRVAIRMTGRFMRGGVAVKVEGSCFFRMRGGLIAEAWNSWDRLGLLQQLEGLPPSAQQHLTQRMR